MREETDGHIDLMGDRYTDTNKQTGRDRVTQIQRGARKRRADRNTETKTAKGRHRQRENERGVRRSDRPGG